MPRAKDDILVFHDSVLILYARQMSDNKIDSTVSSCVDLK